MAEYQLSYTAAEIDAKLGKIDTMQLGIASDGLIYLFVNGEPVGTGIAQGGSGDVFGYVDENNTIVLSGNLADGTYSLKYDMDGESIDIGNVTVNNGAIAGVTNFFDAAGGFYGRLSSTGENRTDSPSSFVTNYIPVQNGDTVRITGCDICYLQSTWTDNTFMSGYDSTKANVYTDNMYISNEYWTVDTLTDSKAQITIISDSIAYLRFTCWDSSDGEYVAVDADAIVVNIKRNGEWLSVSSSYTITNALTNCTNNNTTTQVDGGESYSAMLSAYDGYVLSSVVVTMGGADISASAVSGGNINITNVTGDIIITAIAEVGQAPDPVTVDITLRESIRLGSDGGDRTGAAGACATERIDLSNIPKPCTINLTKARWAYTSTSETGYVMTCARNASGTNLVTAYTNATIGSSYFTVAINDEIGGDVTVTVTSNDVAEIAFSGVWASTKYSDSSSSFSASGAKATLTYTPTA